MEWKSLSVLLITGGGLFLWLSHWDFSATGAFQTLNEQFMPWLQGGLEQTFLGSWKEGKLITALGERSRPIAEIVLKGSVAACYIIVLPIIHPSTRQKWLAKARARLS